MRLCAVDADGDLGAGGTELLEESAVSPDPQILFGDLHLRRTENTDGADSTKGSGGTGAPTHSAQVPRAGRGVQAEEQPRDADHVVLNERLWEQREV